MRNLVRILTPLVKISTPNKSDNRRSIKYITIPIDDDDSDDNYGDDNFSLYM
jgi:hypothetical protein